MVVPNSYEEVRERKQGEETIDPARPKPRFILMEEFLTLQYVAYIRYAVVQMRNLLSFVFCGFILLLLSLYSYPFQARHLFGLAATGAFLVLGAAVIRVFMQMDRDSLLSRINKTAPGRLDLDFVLRVVSYGALPLLTLLAGHVPSIDRFINSLIEPIFEALR